MAPRLRVELEWSCECWFPRFSDAKDFGEGLSALNAAPLLLIVLVVTTLIVFLTERTSNTTTAATFFPVVGGLALGLGEDPRLLAIPTALAASCPFMMPVAKSPNAVVFASKRITLPQMVRAGPVVNLLMIGLIIATVFLLAGPLLGLG